jgi:hypothetical protein
MHTEHKREAPLTDLGYETRDINYGALGKATILFLAFVFFSFTSVGIWFALAQPKTSSVLDPTKPMPEIKVQSNIDVRADIETMRRRETQLLSSSGTNPDGSQRIPIEQAMAIIASRGLARKTSDVKAESPGNTIKQNALPPGSPAPTTQGVQP